MVGRTQDSSTKLDSLFVCTTITFCDSRLHSRLFKQVWLSFRLHDYWCNRAKATLCHIILCWSDRWRSWSGSPQGWCPAGHNFRWGRRWRPYFQPLAHYRCSGSPSGSSSQASSVVQIGRSNSYPSARNSFSKSSFFWRRTLMCSSLLMITSWKYCMVQLITSIFSLFALSCSVSLFIQTCICW